MIKLTRLFDQINMLHVSLPQKTTPNEQFCVCGKNALSGALQVHFGSSEGSYHADITVENTYTVKSA